MITWCYDPQSLFGGGSHATNTWVCFSPAKLAETDVPFVFVVVSITYCKGMLSTIHVHESKEMITALGVAVPFSLASPLVNEAR